MLPSFIWTLSILILAGAAPNAVKRQAITTLSNVQIATFKPYSFFAATAYCQPSNTLNWSCGFNCDANPGFEPIASGGDGSDVQFCK
jgi:hypothetical protein